MSHLVIDVGTSSVRVVVVRPDTTLQHEMRRSFLPETPFPGLVEFDAAKLATLVLEMCEEVLRHSGPVAGVGIANQRASTIVWDRTTGVPVGPALGWQDLRTIGTCLELQPKGIFTAPNSSLTKVAHLLDTADPERARDLCFGTIDTWLAWNLSRGESHITDTTNAAVTAMITLDASDHLLWDHSVLDVLRIPSAMLPTIVNSSGLLGTASALPGRPPITALIGDQQASMIGQRCVKPGLTKVTFGTGGMLDICTGSTRPAELARMAGGCIPISAWQHDDRPVWGIEAVMLSAGTAVEWLRDDLRIIDTAADSGHVAAQCADTGDVYFVPALLGIGTPTWDYGARGTLSGITRGTGRPEIVRAVLEGVAHRGIDLVEAAEVDSGLQIRSLRIDGGMSVNPTFVQALADAGQRPVEVSPVTEATAVGAGLLAGLATGTWSSFDEIAATWQPAGVVEPRAGIPDNRDRWRDAVSRSLAWYPELSAINF